MNSATLCFNLAFSASSAWIILELAHKKSGLANPLVFAFDGQAAVDYLTGKPPYQDRAAYPLPGLILLDLKMPRMDGFDVLDWLGGQPGLQRVPVVVFSSSSNEADMRKARQMGARDYFVKVPDLNKLAAMFQALAQQWLAEHPHLS